MRRTRTARSTASNPLTAARTALRDRLDRLLDRAGDVLSTLRITARRADLDRLAHEARPLPRLSRRLDRFAKAHE